MASSNKKKKQLIVYGLLSILLIVVMILVGTIGNRILAKRSGYTSDDIVKADGRIEVNGQWYKKKNHLKTYLIMGIDKYEKSDVLGSVNNQQSDFNALVVVDLEKKSYTVMYINRDTMTVVQQLTIDGTPFFESTEQLALAHTYGSGLDDSCKNVARAVSTLLYGAPVDHYVAVYLGAIGTLNDAVDGVTVTIEDDFSNVDSSMAIGEDITLTAEQAEFFVRYRRDVADQTNINRMERQKTYLSAWKDKALYKLENDKNFVSDVLRGLGDDLVSDLSPTQISDVSKYIEKFTENEPIQLPGESVQGEEFMEFYVDDDALLDLVLEIFFDKV